MEYYAHTREDGERQTVKAHLIGVSKLAEGFSVDLLKPLAKKASLYHDIGKYALNFQKRLDDDKVKFSHAACGAIEYKTLADKNLALEINTAGLRREIGQTSPTLEYVKLFRELGGELLTFGSDAHRAQDLGAGLDVAIDMAKEAGFSHFAFYKKREPRMLRLM